MPSMTVARKKRQPTAVGCYIFAGGFTIGVRAARFDVLCHLEGDGGYGVPTARLNFPDMPIHFGPSQWPLDELSNQKVDFVFGNPPCAAWSGNNPNSHKVNAWRDDPRVCCTYQHFHVLEVLQPKVWCWESVTQAPKKGRALVNELTEKALGMGYSVTELFHDAKYMGVPQTRKRWFMVCHRIELNFDSNKLLSEVDCVAALSLVTPRGQPATDVNHAELLIDYLRYIPPGGRLRKYWSQFADNKVGESGSIPLGFGHVRLRDQGPASATVGYAMVHPVDHRFLTVNEVQALAGFPQDFLFPESRRGAKELDLIARGVCPPVGEWLARRVSEGLERGRMVTEPVVKIVDLMAGPSSVEPA